jgi:YVTN family beta-propeller protein
LKKKQRLLIGLLTALFGLSFLTPAHAVGEITIAPVTRPYYPTYSPDGSKVYVPSESSNLTVIDTATNAVSSIAMGGSSFFVAFTPDGTSAYVSLANSVRKINVASQTLDPVTISVPVAQEIAISADGKTAYVARGTVGQQGYLDVLDLVTNTVTDSIQVGLGPIGAELSRDGTKVYVANFSSNDVSIFDTTSKSVTNIIAIGVNTGPRKIAFTPDGTKAYVSNQYGGTVRIIDTTTKQLLPTIISGFSTPQDIAITADGLEAFVTNRATDQIFAIDLATNTRIGTAIAATGSLPFGIALNPDPSAAYTAYVANYLGNSLTNFTRYKSRTLEFTSASQNSAQFGSTVTVAAAPSLGVGDGTITFSAGQSTACSVNASTGVVTMTQSSGNCSIAASISNGTVYAAASAPTEITISASKANLSLAAASETLQVGASYAPSFALSSGTLVGSDGISAVEYTFEGTGSTTYGPSQTAPTEVGTYLVKISGATFSAGSADNYNIAYVDGALTIEQPAPQPDVSGDGSASEGADLARTGSIFGAPALAISLALIGVGAMIRSRRPRVSSQR